MYGTGTDKTPEMTVLNWKDSPRSIESRLPPEPSDSVYGDCRLEALIGKAEQLLREQTQQIKRSIEHG